MRRDKGIKKILAVLLIISFIFSTTASFASMDTNLMNSNELPMDYVDNSNQLLESLLNDLEMTLDTSSLNVTSDNKIVEVAFVVDSTGSMGSYINQVKHSIVEFSQYLEAQGLKLRIAVIEYKDVVVDGYDTTKVYKYYGTPWHPNTASVVYLTLQNITVSGGGDAPETPIDALGYLMDTDIMRWGSDSYKFCFLLTDATYKVTNKHGYTSMNEVAADLKKNGINTSVITAQAHYDAYSSLTTSTGGMLLDINTNNYIDIMKNLADSIISSVSNQAIYVIPGYPGAQLYGANGDLYFIHKDNLINDIMRLNETFFAQDAQGSGTNVYANKLKDKFGVFDTYQTIIERLESEFGTTYDVHFFPYNWLEDVKDAAKDLEDHINGMGYKKVTIITHSTGALIAAAYLSDISNQSKVEHALLVAAPIYGTYQSLMPIERGTIPGIGDELEKFGLGGLSQEAFYTWVRYVTQNAPTNYQLLPSKEYLTKMGLQIQVEGVNSVERTSYKGIDNFYEILNSKSSRINSTLLSSTSTRSHKYFRDTTLSGDITKVLKKVNTVLIGASANLLTNAEPVYDTRLGYVTMNNTVTGDGTIQHLSYSSLDPVTGKFNLPFVQFEQATSGKALDHTAVISEKKVLDYICNRIKGGSATAVASSQAQMSISESDKIERDLEYIRIWIAGNTDYTFEIRDASDELIAYDNGQSISGFDGYNFIYEPNRMETGDCFSTLYIPAQGFSVKFFDNGRNIDSANSDFRIYVSTLNGMGYRTATALYNVLDVNYGELLLELNAINGVTIENLGNLAEGISVQPERYFSKWSMPQSRKIELDDSYQMEITGSDAESAFPNITWSSSDESIVTITDDGFMNALGHGRAQIYASYDEQQASCVITVPLHPTNVSHDNIEVRVGGYELLDPIFSPENATEVELSYSMDQEGIISIDEYDRIYGIRPGTVNVTASSSTSGVSITFEVRVIPEVIQGVRSVEILPNELDISIGTERTLSVKVYPETAENQSVEWFCTDDEVVNIISQSDSECQIRAVNSGTAEVIVITQDGGYVDICQITVDERGSVTVYDSDDLYNALADSAVSRIVLGNDIEINRSDIVIQSNRDQSDLVIEGNGYTLTEYYVREYDATKCMRLLRNGTLDSITIKNMSIIGQNGYGTIYIPSTIADFDLNYINVTYVGPQITHNIKGNAYYENVDITIKPASNGSYAGEVAEITNVTLGGEVNIIKENDTDGVADEIFWIANRSGSIVVLPNAEVNIENQTCGQSTPSGFVYGSYGYLIEIGENAVFTYNGFEQFNENIAPIMFNAKDSAKVNITIIGDERKGLQNRPIININGNMEVGESAQFRLTSYGDLQHPLLSINQDLKVLPNAIFELETLENRYSEEPNYMVLKVNGTTNFMNN